MRTLVCVSVALAVTAGACERERRDFRFPPDEAQRTAMVPLTTFQPGGSPATVPVLQSPFEENAYSVSEGKRLYSWYNCVGCHQHGGGGIGHALMDSRWIYGGRPDQIYATIVQGRPNGMPAFGNLLAEPERWRLVAYVRSLSGQVPAAAAPGRDDSMSVVLPESRRAREPVQPAGRQP